MGDFNMESPEDRNLGEEKFPYGHFEEGMHTILAKDDPQGHMGGQHSDVSSMGNGELNSSEQWFSNSLVGEHQRTASPIFSRESALLDDEIWPAMLASVKPKAVHWPEAILVERELKRQRTNVQNASAADVNVTIPIPNAVSPVHRAPEQFDIMSPQDFQSNSGHVLHTSASDIKGEIAAEMDTVHESQSHSQSLGIKFDESEAGVSLSAAKISDTAGANVSEGSGSEEPKDHTAGDKASVTFDVPTNTIKLASGKESVVERDHTSHITILSSRSLQPVGPEKKGGGPKSHHVQLVERHTGLRMISTAGAFADSSLPRESRWAEELLLECALAISSKNVVRTQHLMWVLNDLGCLTGDANQRLAAHGLKSLFCKVTGTGDAARFNPTAGQVKVDPKVVHRALLKFHDVNPWHHMAYTVANSVMIDNFEGVDKVHVIDIGVSQGTQWPTFIEALATRASGPPLLRLTVVKDDGGAGTPGVPQGQTSTDFVAQLERFAKLMGIKIELHTVVSSLGDLTRRKLALKEGEALAICAQFRLHRLPEAVGQGEQDEVSQEPGKPALSERDKFLQFMLDLKPKVVILSENDTDHLDSDFVSRFRPTVDYFWKFLDSTSYSFHGKQSQERQIIECEAAMAMVNNVACEGSQRIERNESHRGWIQRMERAGFVPLLPREEILENIKTLVRKYDSNWEFGTDLNCVVLLWKQQPVTFCSVWKPM